MSKVTNESLILDSKQDKTTKKIHSVLVRRMGWIGVGTISVIYLFWGFFRPDLTNQSLWELFLSAGISMLVALSISNLMSAQGIITGTLDTDVEAMKVEHINVVNAANDYVEYSDEWSENENKIALKSARKHILMSAGLKYELFFDAEGDYLETVIEPPVENAPKYIKKRYQNKLSAVKKALTYQVTPVTMARLTAETSVNLDPNKLDAEPSEYQKAKTIKSIWQKVATVAIFGRITFSLIENSNIWESLFNGALQLVVFLLFGIISYYSSYIYMTNTYVGNLRKKVNLLKRLIEYGKKKNQKIMEVKQNGDTN